MKHNALKIMRPADAFLPAAFLIAALLGRVSLALWLFIGYCAVKLCALATSDGLRRAFARQPAMRGVQGSAALALMLQFPGALIACLMVRFTHQSEALYPLVICGLLLNIEHVFYEYLYAIGDDFSATMLGTVTAVLTLTGLLLCAPAATDQSLPSNPEFAWIIGATSLSALIGLTVSLLLGGKCQPRLNAEPLRAFPPSMLQAALYPAAALAALRVLAPALSPALPLFAGWVLYELCRSPFRRTPPESWPMNRALLTVCAAASLTAVVHYLFLRNRVDPVVLPICLTVILAALCAFALFGNIRLGRRDEA